MDTGKRNRRPRKNDKKTNERVFSSDIKKGPYQKRDDSFQKDKKTFSGKRSGEKEDASDFSKGPYRKNDDSFQKDKKTFSGKRSGEKDGTSDFSKGPYRKNDDSFQKDKKTFSGKRSGEKDGTSDFSKGQYRKNDDSFQKDRKPFQGKKDKSFVDKTDSLESLQKSGVFRGGDKVFKKEDEETLGRLNKYIANSGICSRRQADEYIAAGLVKVNDVVVTEMGVKVKLGDVVKYNGERIRTEKKLYVLLNKPKDFVTTMDDPEGRKTVMDLVKSAGKERIYPVGRLDRNTTGVLLLTNDGELATKLTHPKYNHKKIYHVFLEEPLTQDDFEKLAAGVELEDGKVKPDGLSYVNPNSKAEVGIEIHSGKNRIIRRMFEALNYKVTKLDRVYFAGLTKKGLSRGQWRYLNEKEINMLRMSKLG
ncbi:MAG: rRNA pseudouridine synthase [Bacteroidales bacterium]|nr:rRNA pseudouridine synthase [Bacteroidales bacterium]MCF8389964.1 rRNA pseudouridine synthase [Bacteroidales bacterium]